MKAGSCGVCVERELLNEKLGNEGKHYKERDEKKAEDTGSFITAK